MSSNIDGLNAREQRLISEVGKIIGYSKQKAEEEGEVVRDFGIALIHNHYPLNDGEVLHEVSHVAGRVSVIRPVLEAELPDSSYVSVWTVDSQGATKAHRWCCD
jgi:hypothetical protein